MGKPAARRTGQGAFIGANSCAWPTVSHAWVGGLVSRHRTRFTQCPPPWEHTPTLGSICTWAINYPSDE